LREEEWGFIAVIIGDMALSHSSKTVHEATILRYYIGLIKAVIGTAAWILLRKAEKRQQPFRSE